MIIKYVINVFIFVSGTWMRNDVIVRKNPCGEWMQKVFPSIYFGDYNTMCASIIDPSNDTPLTQITTGKNYITFHVVTLPAVGRLLKILITPALSLQEMLSCIYVITNSVCVWLCEALHYKEICLCIKHVYHRRNSITWRGTHNVSTVTSMWV